MPLTDIECRNAQCPTGRPYLRLADGGGLYLEVMPPGARNPAGSKLWRWKYRFDGKEKRLALGSYPDVPLASRRVLKPGGDQPQWILGARDLREEARKLLKEGIDPGEARRDAKRAQARTLDTTFEPLARAWFAGWSPTKTERYAQNVLSRLAADVFPEIGHRQVAGLAAADFTQVAEKIEARGARELARRLLQTCGQVMRYAVGKRLVGRDPLVDVKPHDFLEPRSKKNFARVGAAELPTLLRKIAGYEGSVYTRTALQLMALTFVRTSELIEARWQEFDLDSAEWEIPPERKGRKGKQGDRRPHLVPLSRQAVEVLGTLQASRGLDRCHGMHLLFPGERDHEKPMSNGTLLMALRRMGYQGRMTGHGFRGVASTALNEMGYRFDVIEAQLSHVDRDKTRAAYNHAQYLEERRELMQGWADYLDAVRRGGKVIPFRQGRKLAA